MFVRFQTKWNGRIMSHKVAMADSMRISRVVTCTWTDYTGTTQASKCLTKDFVVYFKVTSQYFFVERKKSSKALSQTS